MVVEAADRSRVAVEEDVEEIVRVGEVGVPVAAERHAVAGALQRLARFDRRVSIDVDLNADRGEVLDDQRELAGVVELVRFPCPVLDAEFAGESRLAHQRPRLVRIVVVAAQRGVVSERAWREQRAGDDAEAGKDALVDPLAIDGVVDGLAHLELVERRDRAVVSEVRGV